MRMGAFLLLVGLVPYPVPPTIWLAGLVIPLIPMGTALLFPSVTALSSRESDPGALGQTMGVQQAFGAVARIIGPLWATPVFQAAGALVCPFLLGGSASHGGGERTGVAGPRGSRRRRSRPVQAAGRGAPRDSLRRHGDVGARPGVVGAVRMSG